MAYTLKIDGEALPDGVKIKTGSLNLDQSQAGERAVLKFELIDMNTGGAPFIWSTLVGQTVELYDDGVLVFGGQLDEPETRKINEHPVYGEKIACIDWVFLTDRAYINQSYQRQLISDTFKDMIDEFLAADGIYYDYTIVYPGLLQDTYIGTGVHAAENYSNNAWLSLEYHAAYYNGVVLEFDLSAIAGKTLISAELTLYRMDAFAGLIGSAVRYINAAWDEETVTFNNLWAKLDGTDYGYQTHPVGAANSPVTWDLLTLMQLIANGTIANYNGLYIYPGGAGDQVERFYDASGGDYKPVLTITYEDTSIVETTGQYVSINCPYVKASDAFDEMAGLINWQWRIGPDKKFYLNEYDFDYWGLITEHVSNYLPSSLCIWDDRSEYRNRQVYRDVNAITDFLTEKATPTPDQDKTFSVRFPLNNKPEIYISDNITDPPIDDLVDPHYVGINGLDTGMYFYWNKNSNSIQQDTDAEEIPEGKYLVVKYYGQYKIDIIESDAAAIAERQAVEGGSGLYTNVENAAEIEGIAIAEDRAQMALERFARIATKMAFASYTIDINVGQYIHANIPSLNIDTVGDSYYFLVIEKRISDRGKLLLKEYTLIDGAPLGNWIKFFSRWIKPGKDWEIRPDAVVVIPIDSDESWDWSGQVTITTYDCLYPETDPGGLYPSALLYPGTLTSTAVETD